ncbi:hypothetical protein CV014_12965 [Nostoc sp. CMAA1605]|nr:hypothetical protein [Nostoc sp. CMAA1605]
MSPLSSQSFVPSSLELPCHPLSSLIFLRLFLAILVIFSHSYELGGYGIEPFKTLYKFTLGDIAVHGFFGLSGFLITASFMNTSI